VSTFRPFLLRQPRVCFRSRRLLPSYAPRNANISPNFSTLRILPVATGVWGAYFQLSTLCLCACPSGRRASVANAVPKSCRVILLRTLCRSLRSFSHSRPLFSIVCRLFSQNTGGWGTLRQPSTLPTFRPAQADMAARKSVEARFGKRALQKQSQRQDAAFGLGALKATPLHFRGTARNRCATLAGEKN
jgi:hypothetical protein